MSNSIAILIFNNFSTPSIFFPNDGNNEASQQKNPRYYSWFLWSSYVVIQLRSLATLSHRRSLGVGRAPGTGPCNTNSNEVVGVESEKLRQGGLELFFFFWKFHLKMIYLHIIFFWVAGPLRLFFCLFFSFSSLFSPTKPIHFFDPKHCEEDSQPTCRICFGGTESGRTLAQSKVADILISASIGRNIYNNVPIPRIDFTMSMHLS